MDAFEELKCLLKNNGFLQWYYKSPQSLIHTNHDLALIYTFHLLFGPQFSKRLTPCILMMSSMCILIKVFAIYIIL